MSNLSPWLRFDSNYLAAQTSLNRTYNQSSHVSYPRWGCGPTANSLSGFWKWGGGSARTPNMYHQTKYTTNMPTPEMLQNTHEMVHASVRARLRLGGKNADGKTGYQSKALKDWALQNTSTTNGSVPQVNGSTAKGQNANWVYTGQNKDGKNANGQAKVMEEDELGVFELQLLELVDPSAKAELFDRQ